MNKEMLLWFGAAADGIAEQLSKQGLGIDAEVAAFHQRDADAIVRLSVSGLLSDSAKSIVLRKLIRRIAKDVRRE